MLGDQFWNVVHGFIYNVIIVMHYYYSNYSYSSSWLSVLYIMGSVRHECKTRFHVFPRSNALFTV